MSLAVQPPNAALPTPSPRNAYATQGYATSRDGTRIHYYSVGEGPVALVCCDGVGCDGYVWKYIADDLSAQFRVVRWHYRGHGLSETPGDFSRYRLEHLCEDLDAVLEANGLDKVVLLGHSLGAQVILEYHRQHAERVLALVPVCGTYGRLAETFRDSKVLKRALPLLLRAVDALHTPIQRVWTRALDTELAYQIAIRTDVNGDLVRKDDFRPYLTHLANMNVRAFFRLVEDATDNDNLLHLQNIDVPTLIVGGEKDGFTPFWLSAVMHARIPESELLSVPEGTHTAPIEMPELVTLRLRRFLEDRVLPKIAPAAG